MSEQTIHKDRFDWYRAIEPVEPLEQGDILFDFPIMIPPQAILQIQDEDVESEAPEIIVEKYNVVLMTQSCDLSKMKAENEIIFCPLYDYSEIIQIQSKYGGQDGWKSLRSGRFISTHLINRCTIEEFLFDFQVVDLRRIFSVPLAIVRLFIEQNKKRIRLLPPYREHLAQAFARQFMRIGLPVDLPPTYPYKR